jgi:[protein-PII] uridylyltransferase
MAELKIPAGAEQSSWLRAQLAQARDRMAGALRAGASGRSASQQLADVHDQLVAGLWHAVADQVPELAGAPLALLATGGWGRREMAPFSDIDLLLVTTRRHTDLVRDVAERLLYPLWDAGIRVGHAVKQPEEAASLARRDLATATALLDARLVAGDEALCRNLLAGVRRSIAPGGNANEFVARLAGEQRKRHQRFGASIYLLEPNLKQGIGALRDLATALWAARARWSAVDPEELIMLGYLTRRQVAALVDARDFLLRLRALVQLQAGRPTDQLTFEIQEAIAPGLYPDARLPAGEVRPAVAPAVEALMQRYYLHAREVAQVTDMLLASAQVPERRRPRIGHVDHSFLTFNGKLATRDPQVFREHPAEMLRLFRVAQAQEVPIYWHTVQLVSEITSSSGELLCGNPEAARHFLDALIDPRDRQQPSLLEQMHQVGLLNAVMPEFAPCTCRVQHDLYHVYTVDQHQLYTVALLKRLARGELAQEAPDATAAVAEVTRPEALYLATLLHDVGKPLGSGHAEKGAQLAGTIGRRLGMSARDVDTCEFLVRQHLTMSHISQRRDLSDPDVIRKFAGRIGDVETLVMLYLLTYCDTAMTAPGNLNEWKAQLLRDLYLRTREYLSGGAGGGDGGADQARRARERVVDLLARSAVDTAEQIDDQGELAERRHLRAFLDGVDERFLQALTPRQMARHVRLAQQRQAEEQAVALLVTPYPLKGHTELALVADDSPGFLAAVAGILAAHRVDILGACVGSRHPDGETAAPLVLDLFFVRASSGEAIAAGDPRWERIRADLQAWIADRDSARIAALIERKRSSKSLRPRVTPAVLTEIRVVSDASAEFTVVEVSTRDRVGVLWTIAHTMAELGLDIQLAKVATEGERATDAFYVCDRQSRRKLDEVSGRRLAVALETALAGLTDEGT